MTTAFITGWIRKEEAQAKRMELIANGTYTKSQIKLSSYRWADLNDHSKGYLARVYVEAGIHPELELGETGRKKSTVQPKSELKAEFAAESSTGCPNTESEKLNMFIGRADEYENYTE